MVVSAAALLAAAGIALAACLWRHGRKKAQARGEQGQAGEGQSWAGEGQSRVVENQVQTREGKSQALEGQTQVGSDAEITEELPDCQRPLQEAEAYQRQDLAEYGFSVEQDITFIHTDVWIEEE